MEISQPAPNTKLRDFSAGAFTWFFVANFIFGVLIFETPAMQYAISDMVFFYLLMGPLWLATIILPPVLYAKGYTGFAWGIAAAALINCAVWLARMIGPVAEPFRLITFMLPFPGILLLWFDD
jgi:hypothetical protein